MGVRLFLAAIAAFFLAACNFAGFEHDPESVFEDPAAYEASDRVIAFIRDRDFESFYATFPAEAHGDPELRKTFLKVFDALPGDGDLKITRFYSELRQGEGEYAGIPVYMSLYDVEGGGEFAQLTLAVYPENGVCCSTSYTGLTPADRLPSVFNAFTFEGKGWVHYLMFGLLVAIPVFMVATAVLCFFEKRVRHRWLWIPFILVGLWGVTFNWTTGAMQFELFGFDGMMIQFKLFSIHLLGTGYVTYGPFQPWILTIGSPVGAVAYLIRRRFYKPPAEPLRSYETAA